MGIDVGTNRLGIGVLVEDPGHVQGWRFESARVVEVPKEYQDPSYPAQRMAAQQALLEAALDEGPAMNACMVERPAGRVPPVLWAAWGIQCAAAASRWGIAVVTVNSASWKSRVGIKDQSKAAIGYVARGLGYEGDDGEERDAVAIALAAGRWLEANGV